MTEPELAELEVMTAEPIKCLDLLHHAAPALLAHVRHLQGLIRDLQEEKGYLPSIEQARRDEREACARLVSEAEARARPWSDPVAAEGVARVLGAIAAQIRARE